MKPHNKDNILTLVKYKELFENIEVIELNEESTSSTSTTTGVENPDSKPISSTVKRSKFMGHPCIEVDDDTYTNCVKGKQPFARWSKYVEDEDLRSELKKTFQANKRVLVKNSLTGGMVYIK